MKKKAVTGFHNWLNKQMAVDNDVLAAVRDKLSLGLDDISPKMVTCSSIQDALALYKDLAIDMHR